MNSPLRWNDFSAFVYLKVLYSLQASLPALHVRVARVGAPPVVPGVTPRPGGTGKGWEA